MDLIDTDVIPKEKPKIEPGEEYDYDYEEMLHIMNKLNPMYPP